MQKFYTDHKGNLRFGNIQLLLEVAVDNYVEVSVLRQEFYKNTSPDLHRILDIGELSENDSQVLSDYQQHRRISFKKSLQGIIALTAFFEGLINEIGMIELGNKYYKDNLDKLSILSKWEIVLKLIYGKGLDRNSSFYKNLQTLIQVRNKLVHFKSSTLENSEFEGMAEKEASEPRYFIVLRNSLWPIDKFVEELKSLDSKKGILNIYDFAEDIQRVKATSNLLRT